MDSMDGMLGLKCISTSAPNMYPGWKASGKSMKEVWLWFIMNKRIVPSRVISKQDRNLVTLIDSWYSMYVCMNECMCVCIHMCASVHIHTTSRVGLSFPM